MAEVWERRPLHVARGDASWYHDLVQDTDLIEAITTADVDLMELATVRGGVKTFPTTRQRALDAYREGATVVANYLHQVSPRVARLCRALEAFFHQPFQANAYLTPASSQGFGAHFDVHDVFILQLAGRKHWRIHPPVVELPSEELLRSVSTEGLTPALEAVLAPGDLLYLPRGWVHEGWAVEGEPSLHLSLGLLGFSWSKLLEMTLRDLTLHDARFRELVRFGPTARSAAEVGSRLGELLEALRCEVEARGVARAHEGFVLGLPAVAPVFPVQKPRLAPDERVQRDPLVVALLSPCAQGVELVFQGKRLQMPGALTEILTYALHQDGAFCAGELPGALDLPNRVRLLEYLCAEGLLRRVAEERACGDP